MFVYFFVSMCVCWQKCVFVSVYNGKKIATIVIIEKYKICVAKFNWLSYCYLCIWLTKNCTR
jgi:hypothetical protein